MDYKEIIKEKLGTLPPTLRTFVLDEAWRNNVSKIGKQFTTEEDKLASLENEVFLCLICLEPTKDFVENIKREVGIDEDKARRISNYINGTVFGPVMNDIKNVWASIEQDSPELQAKSGVVDSFEQAIINQAKAMRTVGEAPANLPTGNSSSSYQKGADPYRESAA